MSKLVALVALAFCVAKATSQGIMCPQGTVVYPVNSSVVFGINATVRMCPEGQNCGLLTFQNTDKDGTSFIETGFCYPPEYPAGCDDLSNNSMVGDVSDCSFAMCSSDDATACDLSFASDICNVGTVVYSTDKKVVIQKVDNPGARPCQIGQKCGMYRWMNTENNYTTYIESGLCLDDDAEYTCDALRNSSEVTGVVTECSFVSGEPREDLPEPFAIEQLSDRGYRCDQGTFAYSLDKTTIYDAINVTSAPCAMGESCGMYRFVNTNDKGEQSYIESGFCAPPLFLFSATCDDPGKNGADMVSNCSYAACSGDLCEQFSHLEPPPSCPPRAHWNDLQVLPGCTAKEALNGLFTCLEPLAASAPFNDSAQCSTAFDAVIGCLAGSIGKCVAYEEDGVTLCPSVLSSVPGIDAVFQVLETVSQSVANVESLKSFLTIALNATDADLAALDMFCSAAIDPDAALQALMNATSALMGVELNIGPPVCKDNRILDDLIMWALEYAEEMLKAESHNDMCLSYDKLKARMVDAVENRCFGLSNIGQLLVSTIGPYYAGAVQKGIDIAKEFLFHLSLPNCEGVPYLTHVVCEQGLVVYTLEERVPIYSENLRADACPPDFECGMINWINTNLNDTRTYIEFGYCHPSHAEPTCDEVRNDPRIKRVENCSAESCDDDHRCVNFTQAKCKEVEEDDVAILPRCSLKSTLNKSFDCLGSFVEGYPFQDQGTCRSEVDHVVQCVRWVVMDCLSGDCPTILDFIPGLRQIYPEVVAVASQIDSLRGGLKMLSLDEDTIEFVYSMICHEPGTSLPSVITDLLDGLDLPPLGEPLCSNDILERLIHIGVNAATAVFEAENHEALCTAFSAMKEQLTSTWSEHCDASKLPDLLYSFAGNSLDFLLPSIDKGVKIVMEFMEELEIPGCMNVGGNMTLPDCSRFYSMTSQCGMRQAWLCDYVSWKFHSLSVWLPRFNEYSAANLLEQIPLPPCAEMMDDMCVDSQMTRCGMVGGCRMCFCEDHRYNNVAKIMQAWRDDYGQWKLLMHKYMTAFSEAEQCGMM